MRQPIVIPAKAGIPNHRSSNHVTAVVMGPTFAGTMGGVKINS